MKITNTSKPSITELTNKPIAAISAVETRAYRDVASALTSREEAFLGLPHQT